MPPSPSPPTLPEVRIPASVGHGTSPFMYSVKYPVFPVAPSDWCCDVIFPGNGDESLSFGGDEGGCNRLMR